MRTLALVVLLRVVAAEAASPRAIFPAPEPFGGPCSPQEAKNALPSEDAQSQAEKTVRATYKDEFADASPAGQQKLARRLLDLAEDAKENLALRYVLFRDACEAATRAGDLETLLRGVDELHGGFHVVGLSLKEPFLLKMEPALGKPEDLKRLGEVLVRLAQEAVDLDQYDVAARAVQSSLTSARRAKDASLSARADATGKSVAEMKAAFEKARKAEEVLASAPDDAGANLVWGEWLCFQKGRWDRGLGFLTKAPNSPVKAMALREFSGSAELGSLMEIADGWWELAEREARPSRRAQLVAHARSIYTAALPKSSGEIRAKIGKRLEFDPASPGRK
jgi:hypothetical protein